MSQVITALFEAQDELKNLVKTALNPHFEHYYTPLPEVLDALRPILRAHGLIVLQPTKVREDGIAVVITSLYHKEGGEPLTCDYPLIPAKNDPQGMASALTYARRYSLMALLGISSYDDDDDGNTASNLPAKPSKPTPAKPAKATTTVSAQKMCTVHSVVMEEHPSNRGGTFFGHKVDGKWCYGKAK